MCGFESKFARSGQVGQTSCANRVCSGNNGLIAAPPPPSLDTLKLRARQMNYLLYWSAAAAGRPSIRPATREKADRWENKYIYESEQTAQTLTNTSSALSSQPCMQIISETAARSQAHPSSAFVFVLLCCGLLWFTFLDTADHPKD